MAWLRQNPSGHFYICFRFGGRRFKRSLKTKSERVANSKRVRLEDTIGLVEAGRIDLPAGADIPTFLLSEGKKTDKTTIKDSQLGSLFDGFFEVLPKGNLEPSSIKTMKTHRKHLERILGVRKYVGTVATSDLQTYIQKRSDESGIRGRTVSATTIRKELTTLRSVWNWAIDAGVLAPAPFPSKGLRYPKVAELPPFQTFEEVLAKTGGLDPESAAARDLWATVFLDRDEIEGLLNEVQARSDLPPFVFPMFVMAAHTGARRSEILRAELGDWANGVLTIRERKRNRTKLTTRRIPASARLAATLDRWKSQRPVGGDWLFCHTGEGRCPSSEGDPISKDEINHFFERALRETGYQHLLGWHVFRHSFCSNCAARGVDQRLIDQWVGHTTDEMRRRYRHLFPSVEKEALQSVFGST